VNVTFTRGPANFNDVFVLYIDSGAAGRNVIGTQVNDRGDRLRSAISYMEASTNKSLTLPSGFDATHAIAIDTSFGGLWSIPAAGSIGNNGLSFISGVGNPTSASQSSFTFSFTLAQLGLTPNSAAQFSFVGTYLNPFGDGNFLGFASNEGYGDGAGFPANNIGQNDFSFSGTPWTYTSVPEPTSLLMVGLVGLAGLARRRRS
jgi:hypothetical protein